MTAQMERPSDICMTRFPDYRIASTTRRRPYQSGQDCDKLTERLAQHLAQPLRECGGIAEGFAFLDAGLIEQEP
jgi:hypothetical protein